MATKHLQIWNNAAFDDGGSASKPSPSPVSPPLRPVSTNARGALIDFDLSKENRSPAPAAGASTPPKKAAVRVAFREDAELEDPDIEGEIARVEEEITRLRSQLEGLQVKKADRDARAAAGRVRGRIVPAKFLELKQGAGAARNPCTPISKRMERQPEAAPGSAGIRRRGMSLGPLEILATPARPLGPKRSAAKNLWPSALKKKIEDSPAPSAKVDRRGVSLGPLEIHQKVTMNQSGGDAINKNPLPSVQNCKKPDSPNLDGIAEVKGATKEKERTLNPKPQPPSPAKKVDSRKVVETPSNAKLRRRGASLGPAEIAAGTPSHRPNNLQLEKEKAVKVDKQPVKRNSSMSPMHQQPSVAKASAVKKATTATMVDKKAAKQEGQASGRLRTKSLFQETASCKRSSKTPKARVVASRYSLACARSAGDEPGSKRRKWSLPELSREKTKAGSSVTGSSEALPDCNISQGSDQEEQVKTDLQVSDASDIEMTCPPLAQSSPPSIMKVAEMLPKIKTFRTTVDDSPRESGCAKRAADLVGKKPFFAEAKDEELNSPCQALTFLDE